MRVIVRPTIMVIGSSTVTPHLTCATFAVWSTVAIANLMDLLQAVGI
jgi:hypothetical protein